MSLQKFFIFTVIKTTLFFLKLFTYIHTKQFIVALGILLEGEGVINKSFDMIRKVQEWIIIFKTLLYSIELMMFKNTFVIFSHLMQNPSKEKEFIPISSRFEKITLSVHYFLLLRCNILFIFIALPAFINRAALHSEGDRKVHDKTHHHIIVFKDERSATK